MRQRHFNLHARDGYIFNVKDKDFYMPKGAPHKFAFFSKRNAFRNGGGGGGGVLHIFDKKEN